LVNGRYILEKSIPIIDCIGGSGPNNHVEYCKSKEEDDVSGLARSFDLIGTPRVKHSFDSISLILSYSPPPKSTGTKVSTTPMAMINDDTPNPPIMSTPTRLNTIAFDKVVYDVMNGTDVFKADGFLDNMFNLVQDVYEGDPLGPTKESALDAPPVKCVRSIYGINILTESGAIYRKVPVVTIGDNVADCRYMLDTSARFRPTTINSKEEIRAKLNQFSYKIDGGIIYETPQTLQDVPGETKQRRVCGDGTVPYWNLIHALSWKDKIDVLTVDELSGAAHRNIVGDKRFFALLKRYCKVIDPRANAMMIAKRTSNTTSLGIKTLKILTDDCSSE